MQRYSQTNVLKRTIFELIAEEIIKRMTQQHIEDSPDASAHPASHSLPNELGAIVTYITFETDNTVASTCASESNLRNLPDCCHLVS